MKTNLKEFFVTDQKKLMIILAMGGLLLFNLLFFVIPLVWGILGSFYDWNPLANQNSFIGLDNYEQALLSPIFQESLKNTVVFTVVTVALRTSLGLVLAVMINATTKGKQVIRSMYFLPVIMPLVAIAIVWKWLYHPRIGLLNMILAMFGIVGPNWLADPNLAMGSVIAMSVWKDVGYAIVIFMAAILNVPSTVYEASDIDGANKFQQFFKITIPLVKPTIIFIVITSLISYFQSFIQIMIMTGGGPNNKTNVISYLIFSEAFRNYRFGYASAISVILFIIIMIVTFIQFKIMGKGDEE